MSQPLPHTLQKSGLSASRLFLSILYQTLRLRYWTDRKNVLRWGAVVLAVSIPLSTTGAGLAAAFVLILFCFRGDFQKLRWHWRTPAVVASALLLALFPLGALWSDASLATMLDHLARYIKMLMIPALVLVLARGDWPGRILLAFAAGVGVLFAMSALHLVWPTAGFWWQPGMPPGVPFKNDLLINMSGGLVAHMLALKAYAIWASERRRALVFVALAAAIVVWSLFVVTSRTGALVIVMLVGLFFVQLMGWRGVIVGGLASAVLAGTLFVASPKIRSEFTVILPEVTSTQESGSSTSSGKRVVYWTLGLRFLAERPILGHGTGSILSLYDEAITGRGYAFGPTDDPHSQFLALAIPFGGLGLLALLAFWGLHLYAVWGTGFYHRVGQAVIAQNALSGLFNSYLFTFDTGWMYVLLISACIAAIWNEQRRSQAALTPAQSRP